MLDYENLRNYLDGVIANKVNKANWRYQDLEDSADLSDDWLGDLCLRKQSEVKELEGLADKLVEEVGVEKAKKDVKIMIKKEKLE